MSEPLCTADMSVLVSRSIFLAIRELTIPVAVRYQWTIIPRAGHKHVPNAYIKR